MHLLQRGWEGYALWFVPVLFLGLCLAKFVVTTNWTLLSVVLLWGIGGMLDYLHINLPWTLSTVPIATSFILIGVRFRDILIFQISIKYQRILLVVALCGGAVLSLVHKTDLAWNHVNPLYITISAALMGYVFVMIFSKFMYACLSKKIYMGIIRIGRETFVILAFSQCVIKILNANFALSVIAKYLMLCLVLFLIVIIKNIMKNAYIYNTHSTTERCS